MYTWQKMLFLILWTFAAVHAAAAQALIRSRSDDLSATKTVLSGTKSQMLNDTVTIKTGTDSSERVVIGDYINSLEEKYHIQIYIDDASLSGDSTLNYLLSPAYQGRRNYSFDLLQKEDLESRNKLLSLFFDAWSKYPAIFIKNSGLKRIIFVKNLRIGSQHRYAMPEGRTNTLYFDVSYVPRRSQEYLRHCIHHEFYHLIEKNFFGNFYYKDPDWSLFNKRRFSYGDGGASAYAKPRYSRKKHPRKGLVTGYCAYGLEEDKAEIFAYLMTSSEFPKLLHWMKRDAYLSSKVAYMLGVIRGLDPEMDFNFFLKINGLKGPDKRFHFR